MSIYLILAGLLLGCAVAIWDALRPTDKQEFKELERRLLQKYLDDQNK